MSLLFSLSVAYILYVNYFGTLYSLPVCFVIKCRMCETLESSGRGLLLRDEDPNNFRVSAQALRIARATYYAKIFGFAVSHDSGINSIFNGYVAVAQSKKKNKKQKHEIESEICRIIRHATNAVFPARLPASSKNRQHL